MPISPFSAAFTACEQSGWSLTNLHIQKLLYFAHKTFLGRTGGQPLIDTDFEAWDLGPVLSPLYFELRQFGSDVVTDVPTGKRNMGLLEHRVVKEVVSHFRGVSAGKLVELTHKAGGAWYNNYQPGIRNTVIPNSDILQEYISENGERRFA